MIHVTLKDGSVKEFENGISVMEIVKGLGAGLYKAACACKVNGELCDLRTVLNEDCALEVLTFDSEEGRRAFNHTASHILAQADRSGDFRIVLLTSCKEDCQSGKNHYKFSHLNKN